MPDQNSKPNNLASVYPEANHGRLQTTNAPLPEEQRIISANIDGSKEYEQFKQNEREEKSTRLSDNLFGRIVFCTIAIAALAFADRLYGVFLPVIGYITKGVGIIFIGFLIYYVVRQIQISIASNKYKKARKNPPQNS